MAKIEGGHTPEPQNLKKSQLTEKKETSEGTVDYTAFRGLGPWMQRPIPTIAEMADKARSRHSYLDTVFGTKKEWRADEKTGKPVEITPPPPPVETVAASPETVATIHEIYNTRMEHTVSRAEEPLEDHAPERPPLAS